MASHRVVGVSMIDVAEWQGREEEGVLYVPKTGAMLYWVRPS